MSPIQREVQINGYHLMVYEWGQPRSDRPDFVFFHATGFHARCWDAVIRCLNGAHCFAIDAYGHGKSAKSPPAHGWSAHGNDAAEIARYFQIEGAIGIGHSMGGNALVRAAAQVTDAFSTLLLVDPVILPREWYFADSYDIEGHFVLNRRRIWESPEIMFESFQGRGPFTNWQDDVLLDYCRYGLLPEENRFALACPPEVEAHIYASSNLASNRDIYDLIPQITQTVRVLRCKPPAQDVTMDFMASPTAPDLADHFQTSDDVLLPDNSHFIPMESPDTVAQHLHELIAQIP